VTLTFTAPTAMKLKITQYIFRDVHYRILPKSNDALIAFQPHLMCASSSRPFHPSACPKPHRPPATPNYCVSAKSRGMEGMGVVVCPSISVAVTGIQFKTVRQILQRTPIYKVIKMLQTDRLSAAHQTFAFFRKERRTSNTKQADYA